MGQLEFLIVEDEYYAVLRLCEALNERFPDAALTCLATEDSALRIQSGRFTAAFVNLKLDGNSVAGFSVIRHLRTLSHDMPIFVVTGAESEESKFEAFKAGATGLFLKDFTGLDGMQVAQTIDERIAAIEKGQRMRKSKNTTLGGRIAALGGGAFALPTILKGFDQEIPFGLGPWLTLVGCISFLTGVFMIGKFGRDHDISDEEAGAGNRPPKP